MTARSERGQVTRQALIAGARGHFGHEGYELTSIEVILQETGVSRGALYHHFAGKEDLFLAVLHDVEADIASTVIRAARSESDPLMRLRAGCKEWLRLAQAPEVQRIALIDAPSVVGWEVWRSVDEEHILGTLREGVSALADAGHIASELVEPTAHMLLAALNEAALYAARGPQDATKFRLAEASADAMLTRMLGPREVLPGEGST